MSAEWRMRRCCGVCDVFVVGMLCGKKRGVQRVSGVGRARAMGWAGLPEEEIMGIGSWVPIRGMVDI